MNDGGEGECLGCQAIQDCGDGFQEGTEACDDGVLNGSGENACLLDCSRVQDCGDGNADTTPNGTEVCDDGTNNGGPGECLPGCQKVQTCGDSDVDGNEVCDDGVNDGGDGECLGCTTIQDCGDSVTNGDETCDDGSNDGGPGECLDCTGFQTCGDGLQEGMEICESGDTIACTALSGSFTGGTATCNPATCESWDTTQCVDPAACGNGQLDPGETCDDGNNNGGGDGFCTADCSEVQVCGNGNLEGTESCDDAGSNGTGNGFCLSNCSGTQVCGDGTLDGPPLGTELCESGDTIACTSLPGGFDGGTATCAAGCSSWDVSACTTAPSTCLVEYDLSATFEITGTTGGLGDQTNPNLDGRIVLEYTSDSSGNITDGPVNVLHYWTHNDFTVSGIVTVATNVHGFAPDCNGDTAPTWRKPGQPGFPGPNGCEYTGNTTPVATASLTGSSLVMDTCNSADYWSTPIEGAGSYEPTDAATGPGCITDYKSVGNVNCSGFGIFCSAGDLDAGDNLQFDTWNQPFVSGPTPGDTAARTLTLSGDASRSTIATPAAASGGFQSFHVPNLAPSRTWVSWTGTRNAGSNTTCN